MSHPRILRSRWQPGPQGHFPAGPAVVSFTDFTADTFRQSWSVALAGLRLRGTWPDTPGAIGMWLWADPMRRRSGSVSVWADAVGLKEFVGRPDHVRIVRAHRGRGVLRSAGWETERFDAAEAWAHARHLINNGTCRRTRPIGHAPDRNSEAGGHRT
ncbi:MULTISPECIES: hypothetical protein [unclassified Streptomyces]|uniref:hypothetical protein n=1 Tax=unclassified Streptomyces TaxID=2593676 RepID=UPI002E814C6F|nr:hypothetical protein [Streptomyces sp. NBC_00589]WTI35503.1 hypothetical protein OIC96_11115 [Streptomyces sp. NBC_00775]WUB30824.1 hypothetical protein OHA51_38615 [Streptomyces sp. NBC_00589]